MMNTVAYHHATVHVVHSSCSCQLSFLMQDDARGGTYRNKKEQEPEEYVASQKTKTRYINVLQLYGCFTPGFAIYIFCENIY